MKPERTPPETESGDPANPGDLLGVRADRIPTWYPEWAKRIAELYFSGTTSAFTLSGNVFDPVASNPNKDPVRYDPLVGFLSGELFGQWDIVFAYDLARGLRCVAGADGDRLKEMVGLAHRDYGDFSELPRDPSVALKFLDRVVQKNLLASGEDRRSIAIIIDHASYVLPRGEPGRMASRTATNLVTLLNWATSPYLKRVNMAVVAIDPKSAALNERLTGNPHVASVELELPNLAERQAFLAHRTGDIELEKFSDYSADEIAELTAGISLSDMETLVQSAREGGRRLDADLFRALKKRLIERQCEGFLEFIEPKWGLDMVVGHEAAKDRLREDAALLARGHLETVPMGYLLCGPVGTGKSFLAQCATGTFGVPCVMLKNFRSKYVGETEGNLQKVLSVLRAMGPVVVIIDEADAMLGDRDQSGDSGTSGRVFAMIAAQMGDTRYRGKILWMLLTCRPDLLPIDLKRQGRAEVHIPLFYPSDPEELKQLFVVLAKKLDATLAEEDVPEIPHLGNLSGADVEGIVGRARRAALLDGSDRIEKKHLETILSQFMPSTENLERQLQEQRNQWRRRRRRRLLLLPQREGSPQRAGGEHL